MVIMNGDGGNTTTAASADSGKAATLTDEVKALSDKTSSLGITSNTNKLDSTVSSSPNGKMIET